MTSTSLRRLVPAEYPADGSQHRVDWRRPSIQNGQQGVRTWAVCSCTLMSDSTLNSQHKTFVGRSLRYDRPIRALKKLTDSQLSHGTEQKMI